MSDKPFIYLNFLPDELLHKIMDNLSYSSLVNLLDQYPQDGDMYKHIEDNIQEYEYYYSMEGLTNLILYHDIEGVKYILSKSGRLGQVFKDDVDYSMKYGTPEITQLLIEKESQNIRLPPVETTTRETFSDYDW